MSITKKHTIIPEKMIVQLKDENNNNIEIENILCHLNIYTTKNSYHTFSFIPTDPNGTVILKKEDIINRTELRHHYDESLVLDETPVKFEFFIMTKEILELLIPNIKKYLEVNPKQIKEDLLKRGFNEAQTEEIVPKAFKKQKEDKKLYDTLRENRNVELDYTEENSKIDGFWTSKREYKYELKL